MKPLKEILTRLDKKNKKADFYFSNTSALGVYYSKLVEEKTGQSVKVNESIKRVGTEVRRWLEKKDKKPWLLMLGDVGTGKSTMARALQLFIEQNNLIVHFMTAGEFTTLKRENQLLWSKNFAIIILDDLGREPEVINEFGTKYKAIEEFFLTRYKRLDSLRTVNIFTTNLNLKELEEMYGAAVFSRITEMCEIINFSPVNKKLTYRPTIEEIKTEYADRLRFEL